MYRVIARSTSSYTISSETGLPVYEVVARGDEHEDGVQAAVEADARNLLDCAEGQALVWSVEDLSTGAPLDLTDVSDLVDAEMVARQLVALGCSEEEAERLVS